MNLRYDVVVCGIFILTSTPAWTSECCKLQSNIELPGPAIGSAFECEIGDECSLQIDNVEVGVTSGVISWKELKGNYLQQSELPMGATSEDSPESLLSKLNRTNKTLKIYSVKIDNKTILSTDLCMIGKAGEWYEIAFEFVDNRLVSVIERVSIL
jgi:hypothetical protein